MHMNYITATMNLGPLLMILMQLLAVESRKKKINKNFRYEDCGTNLNRPIRVENVKAYPVPIRAPGRLKVSATVNITEKLPPRIGVDVMISKFFFGVPFKIPCFKNIGTCHYKDICSLLEVLEVRYGCPRKLKKSGIPCLCPFGQGIYHLNRLKLPIPRIDGVLGMIAKGEYEARVRVYDEANKRELGCLKVSLYMKGKKKKKKNTDGWFYSR